MNPFVVMFRAPFIVLETGWQIMLMLIQAALLGYALARVLVALLMLAGRIARNAYYRRR